MKITLTYSDEVRACTFHCAEYGLFEGACFKCGTVPFKVQGGNMRVDDFDTYAADAVCVSCRDRVGTIRAQVSTIFGIEEDTRVLHGRPRVY